MATSAVSPETTKRGRKVYGPDDERTVSKSIFNLETLEEEKVKKNYKVWQATSVAELQQVSHEDLLRCWNKGKVAEAREEALKSIEGPSTDVIMAFIKQFRQLDEFSKIENRSEQTKAILTQVKAVPFLLNGLNQMIAKAAQEEEEEDGENES